MAKVGILSFSDGREFVYRDLEKMVADFEQRLVQALQRDGHEVVTASQITSNVLAKSEAQRLADAHVDCTIFNYCVWCFPHFTAIAAQFVPHPILASGCINPKFPGMVGLLAGVGGLNQLGIDYFRAFGDIEDTAVLRKVQAFVRAGYAVNKLRGETFAYVGGRPMGMYTAVSNPDEWMQIFGVDVEHIDQWEIVRRSDLVEKSKIENAFNYLTKMLGDRIHYDGKQLTPELLKRQLASYYAMLDLKKEWHYDFCGIKGQPELTNHFCTMDVTEAFLNDPYGPDGEPHEPIVCSTEADMDAALTMEIFKHISLTPVLFADVRHYFEEEGVFDLVNSGEHATYFAGKSFKPEDNLPNVHFFPEGFYFPAGGASVFHFAQPGEVTLARLTRKNGEYWMAICPGEFVRFGEEKDWEMARSVQDNWPHAFWRPDAAAEEFLDIYASNHIHGVYGNCVEELENVCRMLQIEAIVIS